MGGRLIGGRTLGQQSSDSEIIAYLTEGGIPIDHFVLYREAISSWNPDLNVLMTRLIDNDAKAARCRAFLRRRRAGCEGMPALNQWALRHGWPGWPGPMKVSSE